MRQRMLGVLLGAAVLAAAPLAARPARATESQMDPFKAKLVTNVGAAGKTAAALTSIAKRPPPHGIGGDQRKAWDEQTRYLRQAAGRFASLKSKMETVLAKTKSNASEVAQVNMELVTLRDTTESESKRWAPASPACHDRYDATLSALKIER